MSTDLTRAQLRALLQVASSPRPTSAHRYADLLDAAVNRATPVDELTTIKDVAKGHLERATDRHEREEAAIVYHAAVAAAFVHHGVLISGRAMRKQRDIYREFAESHDGEELGRLFREALAAIDAGDAT